MTALCPHLIWQLCSFLSERGFVLESCDNHCVCEHSPISEKSFEWLSGQDPYAMILEIVLEFSRDHDHCVCSHFDSLNLNALDHP